MFYRRQGLGRIMIIIYNILFSLISALLYYYYYIDTAFDRGHRLPDRPDPRSRTALADPIHGHQCARQLVLIFQDP